MSLKLCKISKSVTALIGVCYSIEHSSLEAAQIGSLRSIHPSSIDTKLLNVQRGAGKRIVTIQITLPEEEDFSDSTDSSDSSFLTEITVGVQHLIEESIETKKMEQLQNKMIEIIAGDTGIAALFPQREEDLNKIDDVKRNQFISLVQWILKVVKPEVATYIKAKIIELDHNFVTLITEKWGEDIYEPCDLDTPLSNYKIPCVIFGGLDVDSILSINPDLISESSYREFRKLISVINIAIQHSNPMARIELDDLETKIRQTVATKFTSEAIRSYLADHTQAEIEKSIDHYKLWGQLVETLL